MTIVPSHYQATEYRMINHLELKHFRCFANERLSDCRRINIVVGENGSGKTALLEGIFLASCSMPDASLRLRQWRGYEGGTMQGSAQHIQDTIWRDFFHNFDVTRPVYAGIGDGKKITQSLTISHHTAGVAIPLSNKPQQNNRSIIGAESSFSFKWKFPKGVSYTLTPTIADGAIKFPPMPSPEFETFFFAANHTYSAFETANRFSVISRRFGKEEVIDQFNAQFPMVTDLSVELMTGLAMVYATSKSFSEMVPINLVSSGMSKLASIVFAIASQPHGVVIIDELESGFYYKKLPGIWKMLHAFCEKYDTQIFASTHSDECLRAAATVAEGYEEDFSLIRAVSGTKGALLREFSGKQFVQSVSDAVEVR